MMMRVTVQFLVVLVFAVGCRSDADVASVEQQPAVVPTPANPVGELTATELGELQSLKLCADPTYEPHMVRYGDGVTEGPGKDANRQFMDLAMTYFLMEDVYIEPCMDAFARYSKLIPSERETKFPGVTLTSEKIQERIKDLRQGQLRRLAQMVNFDGVVMVHLPAPEGWVADSWNNGRIGLMGTLWAQAQQMGYTPEQILPALEKDGRFFTIIRNGCKELSDHIEAVRNTKDIEPHRQVLCTTHNDTTSLAACGNCKIPVPADLCLTEEEAKKLNCSEVPDDEAAEPAKEDAAAPAVQPEQQPPPPAAKTLDPKPAPAPEVMDPPVAPKLDASPNAEPATLKRVRRVRSILPSP